MFYLHCRGFGSGKITIVAKRPLTDARVEQDQCLGFEFVDITETDKGRRPERVEGFASRVRISA